MSCSDLSLCSREVLSVVMMVAMKLNRHRLRHQDDSVILISKSNSIVSPTAFPTT